MQARHYYLITLTAYLGIMTLIPAWYGWLAPAQLISPTAMILMLALPMFTALRGLLHGRVYTFTWSLFLALLYFSHGVIEAWTNEPARMLAVIEILLSLCWLGAGIMYVRIRKAEG